MGWLLMKNSEPHELLLLALLLAAGFATASERSAWPPPLDPVLMAAWQRGLEYEHGRLVR